MTDTSNRISVISTILGRMDRNIDGNMATGLDGEDENLIVDFGDSTFNRVFLFFYIPDNTGLGGPFSVQTPTRFMTGWGDFAQLAERIYWFGANSTQSHIWPMYSAEDSLSPNDDNIYLGRWLQGTGTWTNQHYFTECQNIFRGQIKAYSDSVLLVNSLWYNTVSISGDAFFKYGLNVLDSLRNQDRFPNFYTRPACYQYKLMYPATFAVGGEYLTDFRNSISFLIKDDITFEKWKIENGTKASMLISYQGKLLGELENVSFKNLSAGFYSVVSSESRRRIIVIK